MATCECVIMCLMVGTIIAFEDKRDSKTRNKGKGGCIYMWTRYYGTEVCIALPNQTRRIKIAQTCAGFCCCRRCRCCRGFVYHLSFPVIPKKPLCHAWVSIGAGHCNIHSHLFCPLREHSFSDTISPCCSQNKKRAGRQANGSQTDGQTDIHKTHMETLRCLSSSNIHHLTFII